jgi:hypothetical protein
MAGRRASCKACEHNPCQRAPPTVHEEIALLRHVPTAGLAALMLLVPLSALAEDDEPILGIGETRAGSFLSLNGTELELDPVYKAHFAIGKPQFWRNMAWQAAILGAGTTWYWTNQATNRVDWEYSNAEFFNRFTPDEIRFDNNSYTINHLSHPVAGGGYYLASRVHNYGVGMSSLISFTSSLIWEAGLEWRERISINDSIFTPGAGIAMGEVYYRLSHYLNSAPGGGTWVHKSLGWLIGWPLAVNRWIDDVEVPNDGLEDRLGFSGAYYHRFRLAGQTARETLDPAGSAGALSGFRTEFDINAIPGFKRPGRLALFFSDGNFTRFDGSFWWAADGFQSVDLLFESVVLGYYEQDYTGPPEAISGTAGRIAMAFSYEHAQRFLPAPRDRRSILHLPGGQFKIWHAWDGWIHDLEIALNPDFTAIDSVAFPLYKANDPEEIERSVLEDHGYYFAWGGTVRLETSLTYGGLSLRGRLRLSYANGVEDWDREQEKITTQTLIEDTLVETYLALGYTHRPSTISGRLELRGINRVGRIDGNQVARDWRHIGLSLGTEF